MLVIVIIAYFHVLQNGDGIIGQRCQREVFREQVAGNTKLVEPHQTGTQRRCYLTGDATLVQSDYTLVLLAYANKDNLRGAYTATGEELSFYFHLVARNQGHAAPEDDLRTEEVGSGGRYAAPCALTLEGGDGTRMGNEECRSFHTRLSSSSRSSGVGAP